MPSVMSNEPACRKSAQHVISAVADFSAELNHAVTQTHHCTGKHEQQGAIVWHYCQCGARFFMVDEALMALVKWYTNENGFDA